ncbi:histidine phosphatase family protein [Pseudooceanicola sp.]|uniref:histidine phosphatase family protein n=1 Tax=Pseudooceanicola sp. TaxID=1914328 RepID=UPI00260AFF53|nr:histidine phosphatase family protein [Pseudooceanicola sp.]MDF1853864.1 histidine phosphatase family protein [Pseudooceanicola sp.]
MNLPPLYLLRHGQTDWNRDGRIQGQMESDLTDLGRAQAGRQGEILTGLSLPKDIRAHVSPLRRTRQTADLAVAPLGLTLNLDDRLKEVTMGEWEGHYYAALRPTLDAEFQTMSGFDLCLNSPGESEAELRARCQSFLEDITGPSIIVSHGIALTILRGVVRGLSYDEMAALEREQGVVIALIDGAETLHR